MFQGDQMLPDDRTTSGFLQNFGGQTRPDNISPSMFGTLPTLNLNAPCERIRVLVFCIVQFDRGSVSTHDPDRRSVIPRDARRRDERATDGLVH